LNDEGTASPYGIATGNVGDENALNTEYTFTASYIQSVFNEAHGLFNTAIRSDNDTNSLYSSWTSTISTTIQNKPAKVSNLASSVDTSGDNLTITWDANDNGFVSASNYKIFSKTDETEWTQVLVTTNTSYTFKATETNSWEFRVDACGSEGDCNSSSTNVTFNYTVPTTTTIPPTEEELNFAETGIYETNAERKAREEREAEAARVAAAIQWERDQNYKETGIYETDAERREREAKEKEQAEEAARDAERAENKEKWDCYMTNAQIERGDCEAYNVALYNSTTTTTTTTTTTIPEIKEEDVIVEEEVKVEEKVEVKSEDTVDTKPIVEDTKTEEIVEEPIEEEIVDEKIIDDKPADDKPVEDDKQNITDKGTDTTEQVEDKPLPSEEGDSEVQLTREEVEVLVKETEAKVKEVVVVEVEEKILEKGATEEEVKAAQEEFEAAVEEVVKELPKEKKVEVVKEVAKVKVQNLATADNTTKAVVKAVVKEVTKVETVAELSEEEKVEVGKVLGFKDEKTAAKDVEIVAEQATKEKNVATAVEEYVDRAIENKDVENYTLADTITEVQVEAFLENPVGSLLDVKIDELDISSLGDDMTSDQKEKAQEVVVPVIIASQIISSAGALMRRF